MSLYPSLEDMQVDKMIQAQHRSAAPPPYNNYPSASAPPPSASGGGGGAIVYPDLGDFMGLELSEQMLATNMPAFVRDAAVVRPAASALSTATSTAGLVAPLSGGSVAMHRAHVTNGIRELVLCKGGDGKVGLRVKDINKGCFVSIVVRGSPAATAGLRFGDQILQVNGQLVAGFSTNQLHDLLRKSPANGISMVVRDRPFERTVTLHRDSHARLGMQLDSAGRVTAIVKDSSAARNGMLTEHHVLEVNAQNVVGMTDKERMRVLADAGPVVTVTVVPSFIYEHMVTK